MNAPADGLSSEPVDQAYEADLLGNIQQALAGLQGFGVMALELIQNADDAGAGVLTFNVCDDALIVRNDGRFSTCGLGARRCSWEMDGDPDGSARPCNFHAISRMGSRSKVHASAQIGRFGIGFVSVYQITDAPIIRSAGIEMRLEPLGGGAPVTTIVDIGGTEFELPWASRPSPTRKALNASPAPDDVVTLMSTEISSVMARGLFFLRHLQRVELHRDGVLKQSVTIRRDGGLMTLEIAPDNKVERWKVLTCKADGLAEERNIFTDFPTLEQLKRSTIVDVAIPLHDDHEVGLLYAYLPTEQNSGMPLHINGDFFPHPNRRSIVLSGEQHERYWNELLLDAAAQAIGESFEELRDLLGGSRLWMLGNAASALREKKGFTEFWKVFSTAAKGTPSVWTVGEQWRRPVKCHLPPEQMTEPAQGALIELGIELLHPDLRPFWTILSSVGVTSLRLSIIVDALYALEEPPDRLLGTPHLRSLWSAVDLMIAESRSRTDFAAVLARLKAATFILDIDEQPTSINDVWRLPSGIRAETIRRYIADCPLIHRDVNHYDAILAEIDVYHLDNFARDIAAAITDTESAIRLIGADDADVRRFYDLLVAFDTDPETSRAGTILANVPMLRTHDGFVSPSRGQLPGGFTDPIGHFELVDVTLLSERMRQLACTVLDVKVLTLKDYVEDHLEDILTAGPTREQ